MDVVVFFWGVILTFRICLAFLFFFVGGGGEGPMTESESVVTSISSCFSTLSGMK